MHTAEAISNVKNASRTPVITAPATLVAANSTPKRIREVKIVPKTPTVNSGLLIQRHLEPPTERLKIDVPKVIARYTTAMPKVTQKNAGATVITAAKRRIAVKVPIIKAATTATAEQSNLQL